MDTWVLPIKQVAALLSGFSHSLLYPNVLYTCPIRSFCRCQKAYSSKETSTMFPQAEDLAWSPKSGMGGPLHNMMIHPKGEIGEDGHYYNCVICEDGGDLLCCDTCPAVYHLQCLNPPLEHVPAGVWQCQGCCEKDVMVGPSKSIKRSSRPESSDHTIEELDAAEALAIIMSTSLPCDKNLGDKDLGTDMTQSLRWKGRYFRRSGLKRRRSYNADLKKDAPCSDRQEEAKATEEQTRVTAPQFGDSDGFIDVPLAIGTIQNVVSSDRSDHLLDVWSEEELDALWVGVRRHGPGNWQMMLDDPILKFSASKTPQHLSLRWDIERQRIIHSESFLAPRTSGVLKIYRPRRPSRSSNNKVSRSGKLLKATRETFISNGRNETNASDPAESEPSLKDWCTKEEEGSSEETVSDEDA